MKSDTRKKPWQADKLGKFKPEYCDQLMQHMGENGLSFESFPAVIGVARSTVNKWVKDELEFGACYQDYAKPAYLLYWERLGVSGKKREAIGMSDPMFFFQKHNRFRSDEQGRWRKSDIHGTHTELFDGQGRSVGFTPVEGYKGSEKI